MTYTYVEPDVTTGIFPDPVSEARYLLGDTDPTGPFSLTDAEMGYEIAKTRNDDGSPYPRAAAANAAYKMGMRYQKEAAVTSKSVGGLSLSVNYSQQALAYKNMSDQIRRERDLGSSMAAFVPSYAVVDTQFTLGQFDYTAPGGGSPDDPQFGNGQ